MTRLLFMALILVPHIAFTDESASCPFSDKSMCKDTNEANARSIKYGSNLNRIYGACFSALKQNKLLNRSDPPNLSSLGRVDNVLSNQRGFGIFVSKLKGLSAAKQAEVLSPCMRLSIEKRKTAEKYLWKSAFDFFAMLPLDDHIWIPDPGTVAYRRKALCTKLTTKSETIDCDAHVSLWEKCPFRERSPEICRLAGSPNDPNLPTCPFADKTVCRDFHAAKIKKVGQSVRVEPQNSPAVMRESGGVRNPGTQDL